MSKLWEGSEVARFTVYILKQFSSVGTGAYTKGSLRDDIIRELKAMRAKFQKKENLVLPKVLYAECMKVVWDA